MCVLQSTSISHQALFNNAKLKCLSTVQTCRQGYVWAASLMDYSKGWLTTERPDMSLLQGTARLFCSSHFSIIYRLSFIPPHKNPKKFACKNWNPKNITLGLLGIGKAIPIWDKWCKLLKKHFKLRSVKLFQNEKRLTRRVHMKREKVGLLWHKTSLSNCWMQYIDDPSSGHNVIVISNCIKAN